MSTIYIIVKKDSSWDRGDPKLIRAYSSKDAAEKHVEQLNKTTDNWTYHYVTSVEWDED